MAYLDATRDNKVIEDLRRETTRVGIERVRFTNQSKGDMVENLAARLETGEIIFPEIDPLIAELEAFTYETTPSGNVRYTAPESMHDDEVDALALAAKGGNASNALV
jgi:hypothetical protein